MLQIAGLILVMLVVAGGLFFSGGPAILSALPFELALICGAALGTLLIANSSEVARDALAGLGKSLKGQRWQRSDYRDLLATLHVLVGRVQQKGLISVEDDIEYPERSPLFTNNRKLLSNQDALDLICDTLRIAGLDPSRRHVPDEEIRERIDLVLQQKYKAVTALHTLADALPALGIVAAVLGIIKTMGAIDQSPEILGQMIAAALLGTFLGVFLAYGLVGPLASRFGQLVDEDGRYLDTIRKVLVAHFSGMHPMRAIEQARSDLPGYLKPDAAGLDQAIMRSRFTRAAA